MPFSLPAFKFNESSQFLIRDVSFIGGCLPKRVLIFPIVRHIRLRITRNYGNVINYGQEIKRLTDIFILFTNY